MAQLRVRNLDDDLVRRLHARAEARGRSVEAEHRAILEDALGAAKDDFREQAWKLRRQSRGLRHTDSVNLIRAERDRGYPVGEQG